MPRVRLSLFGLAILATASCGTAQPAPAARPIASVTSPDVEKMAAQLIAKGIQGNGGAAAPKITLLEEKSRKYEVHEITTHPLHHRSTFHLVRYFMAPEEWILQRFTQNGDGTRTYVFRRLVQGPSLDANPLKPTRTLKAPAPEKK